MRYPDGPLTDGAIELRPWVAADAGWYAATARDPEILRWTAEPADLDEQRVRDAIEAMWQTRFHLGTMIIDAVTGERLGNAGLIPSADDAEVGELSYRLAPAGRSRAAATRAVRLLTGWAWEVGLRAVELHAHLDNVASQRVAERAGLTRGRVVPGHRVVKGVSWDVVFYGMLRP